MIARAPKSGGRSKLAIAVLVLLVVLAVLGLFAQRYYRPFLRSRVVDTLSDRFHSDVELAEIDFNLFPRLGIHGRGLALRRWGGNDASPVIEVAEFTATASPWQIYKKPWKIDRVRLQGLVITIPPRGQRGGPRRRFKHNVPVLIHDLVSDDAELRILTNKPGKAPQVFEIHRLVMNEVGLERSADFQTDLKNATPPGDVNARGKFGPWNPDDPSQTPLSAGYTFENADLGVFNGIGGTLYSRGKFGGMLGEMDVQGETDTPNFTVTIGGRPAHLTTTYDATVDGTNGDTLLHPVIARIGKTTIVAHGAVVNLPSTKGKSVMLDVAIQKGRLEDLLRLVMKSGGTPLSGNLNLNTAFELPSGKTEIIRRLKLQGRFGVLGAHFTNPDTRSRIESLSRRGQGKPKDLDAGDDISDLNGDFALGSGVATFRNLTFTVTGAKVALEGTYSLENEELDFHGKLFLDAKLSQTTTGIKSFMLKAVDPFFRKNGVTVLPIKITGTRANPSFGLDLRHKSRSENLAGQEKTSHTSR